jgi:hypothetical protein
MYLWCAERYHWDDKIVDDLPLQVYIYLPVMWAAIERIEAERARKQERGGRGYVR